jgi:hypothetical protein
MRRKHEFVDRLQEKLATAAYFGIAYSIRKESWLEAKRRHREGHSESAFGHCFRVIADTVMLRTKYARP